VFLFGSGTRKKGGITYLNRKKAGITDINQKKR
jgi:hypothetical protein